MEAGDQDSAHRDQETHQPPDGIKTTKEWPCTEYDSRKDFEVNQAD
jgi:hypothetical protein